MDLMMKRRALMGMGSKKKLEPLIITAKHSGAGGISPRNVPIPIKDEDIINIDSILFDGVAQPIQSTVSLPYGGEHTIEIRFKEIVKGLKATSFNYDIKSIIIPTGVETIPAQCFYTNSLLRSVTIPDSITSIGANAFSGTAISELTIPNGVIGLSSLVVNCNQLRHIEIPSSVRTISGGLCSGCSSMNYVIFRGETPPSFTYGAGSTSFNNTNDCPIFVPDGSVSAYKQALPNYETRIKPMSEFVEPTE